MLLVLRVRWNHTEAPLVLLLIPDTKQGPNVHIKTAVLIHLQIKVVVDFRFNVFMTTTTTTRVLKSTDPRRRKTSGGATEPKCKLTLANSH